MTGHRVGILAEIAVRDVLPFYMDYGWVLLTAKKGDEENSILFPSG